MSDQTDRHEPYPLSRSEFGRRVGRAKSSVTEACGGPLREACLPGGRIDGRHPCVLAWCAKKGIDPGVLLGAVAAAASPAPSVEPSPIGDTAAAGPALVSMSELHDRTLRQICDQFGSLAAFSEFLIARRRMVDVEGRELKIAQDRDLLVPRGPITEHVFGAFRMLSKQLLDHAPRTLVVRLFSACRAGASDQEGIAIALEVFKPMLDQLKNAIDRILAHEV